MVGEESGGCNEKSRLGGKTDLGRLEVEKTLCVCTTNHHSNSRFLKNFPF